ncbi:hypothetical protein ACWEOG_07255 [Amycolatopsis japonica]
MPILAEAAAWLAVRGIHQWPQRFPVDSVRHQIRAGEALLIVGPGGPIATCVVSESDPELWGETTEPAYYLLSGPTRGGAESGRARDPDRRLGR